MVVKKTGSPWYKSYDPQVPYALDYPDQPLHVFLEQTSRLYPQKVCTIFNNHILTYSQMDRLTDALAAGLVSLGVKPGQRVAILLPNCPQFVLVFYAILKAGGVVVTLNPAYKTAELAFQLTDSAAMLAVTLEDRAGVLHGLLPQTGLRHILTTTLDEADLLETTLPGQKYAVSTVMGLLNVLSAFSGSPRPEIHVSGDDPAIFQYSGGTTGTPKAAVGLHRNLVANSIQFDSWLGGLIPGHEIILAAIPLFHVYGMVLAMNLAIHIAATLILVADGHDTTTILEHINRYRPTLFPGAPGLYRAINDHSGVQNSAYDLSSLKACISGSAPLPPRVKQNFEDLTGARILEGYGLSEAPTATHCNPLVGSNLAGSIGLPLPDVECRIISLENEQVDLPPGQAGELLLRGPQVMAGYHNRPQESAESLDGGWLHTGDVAWMDNEGYFYLVDRRKDLIKAGGLQVWPREVEEVILAHPAVADAGVAGVMDPIYGETVRAWVVSRKGQQVDGNQIINWVRERLAVYKAPRQVVFVEALPRSSLGKLLRRELRRWHEISNIS